MRSLLVYQMLGLVFILKYCLSYLQSLPPNRIRPQDWVCIYRKELSRLMGVEYGPRITQIPTWSKSELPLGSVSLQKLTKIKSNSLCKIIHLYRIYGQGPLISKYSFIRSNANCSYHNTELLDSTQRN
jgi:hypothetical protein